MRGDDFGYCERWILAYLRANPEKVNTAPSIAAALESFGVLEKGAQRVLYALRNLERAGLVTREQVERTIVLWRAALTTPQAERVRLLRDLEPGDVICKWLSTRQIERRFTVLGYTKGGKVILQGRHVRTPRTTWWRGGSSLPNWYYVRRKETPCERLPSFAP